MSGGVVFLADVASFGRFFRQPARETAREFVFELLDLARGGHVGIKLMVVAHKPRPHLPWPIPHAIGRWRTSHGFFCIRRGASEREVERVPVEVPAAGRARRNAAIGTAGLGVEQHGRTALGIVVWSVVWQVWILVGRSSVGRLRRKRLIRNPAIRPPCGLMAKVTWRRIHAHDSIMLSSVHGIRPCRRRHGAWIVWRVGGEERLGRMEQGILGPGVPVACVREPAQVGTLVHGRIPKRWGRPWMCGSIRIHAWRNGVVHLVAAIQRVRRTARCLVGEHGVGCAGKGRHGRIGARSVGSFKRQRREWLWKGQCVCGEERGRHVGGLHSWA